MPYFEETCFSRPKEYKFIYVHNVKDNIQKIKNFLNRNSNGIEYNNYFYDPDISDSYVFYSGKDIDNPEYQFFILYEERYIVALEDDFEAYYPNVFFSVNLIKD